MNSFGEFLKQKRLEKNLTQKQLADLLYLSESAISKWEKDVARPDISLLPQLSEILEVTEHELITASIDTQTRTDKIQAKKWRRLTFSWNLFFYIAYGVALTPCFICNIALQHTLSWFWIVFTSLLLAFSFTNLPSLIKKHKLIFLPLSNYLALCILLATCAIYTNGNWFLIPVLSILFALVIIFVPIYLCKYKVFSKIKKFADFISVGVDFIMLNILLIAIDIYSVTNNYALSHWYFKVALPITLIIYLILNLLLCVRFLKLNKLLKTSIILFIINFITYGILPFIKVKNPTANNNLNSLKVFKANFSNWSTETTLETNIHCIVFLSFLTLTILFFISGLILHLVKKRKQTNKN